MKQNIQTRQASLSCCCASHWLLPGKVLDYVSYPTIHGEVAGTVDYQTCLYDAIPSIHIYMLCACACRSKVGKVTQQQFMQIFSSVVHWKSRACSMFIVCMPFTQVKLQRISSIGLRVNLLLRGQENERTKYMLTCLSRIHRFLSNFLPQDSNNRPETLLTFRLEGSVCEIQCTATLVPDQILNKIWEP